jgi:hypothetical protein|tara:strand:+ start:318 stop:467 length:150 start_codon:yes stop_codon:yes gene_type:complete
MSTTLEQPKYGNFARCTTATLSFSGTTKKKWLSSTSISPAIKSGASATR